MNKYKLNSIFPLLLIFYGCSSKKSQNECTSHPEYTGCLVKQEKAEETFIGAYELKIERGFGGPSVHLQLFETHIKFKTYNIEWGKQEKISYEALTIDRGNIQDVSRFNTIYRVIEIKESYNIDKNILFSIKTLSNVQDFEVNEVAEGMLTYFGKRDGNYYYNNKSISFISETVKAEFDNFIENVCIADIYFELSPTEDLNSKLTLIAIDVGTCKESS